MLKPFKIYLETTIFNFKFAEDSPDKKADTIKLFDEISEGKYIAYTSNYVLQELLKAEEPKRSDMVSLIEKYKIRFCSASDELGQKRGSI